MKDIFKWFTLPDSIARIDWFVDNYKESEFVGVDKVLQLFLQYCSRLGIVATSKYLEVFLRTEGKALIKKHNIKLQAMSNFNYEDPTALEEATRVITSATSTAYENYREVSLDNHEFKVDMNSFIVRRLSERTVEIMADAFPKISAGECTEEVVDNLQVKLNEIRSVYSKSVLDKLDFLTGKSSKEGENEIEFLAKTGIPCIDGDIGGIYTGFCYTLTGSPGVGKTQFMCAHFVYPLLIAGYDVLYDLLEMKAFQLKNILIAHHIIHLYRGKVKISFSSMTKRTLSEEQKRYYEAAKIDLFESGKYGKLIIRKENLVVEKINKEMRTFFKNNKNCRFWIIDYAGLAESQKESKYDKDKQEYEIIQQLYKNARKVIDDANAGLAIINQFNKEGSERANAGKSILPGMVQGGMFIDKHIDYGMALCWTEEQKITSMATLSTTKTRGAGGFSFVPFDLDLAVAIFNQKQQEAVR